MTDTEDLDSQVKAADPDRWMSSRLIADAQARADVVALYALNHLLARIAPSVTEPMMGHIRIAWWREAMEELAAGKPARAHPGVEAMADPMARGAFSAADLDALIDARADDLEPPTDEAGIYAQIDATAGKLAAMTAKRLDPTSPPGAVTEAMRAWGLAGLGRARRLPHDWDAAEVARRVDRHLKAARAELKALPVRAFPAVAYAAFSRAYAQGRDPGPFDKQLRLLGATLRGAP